MEDGYIIDIYIQTYHDRSAEPKAGYGPDMDILRSQLHEDEMNALEVIHSHSNTCTIRIDPSCKGDQQYEQLSVVGRCIVAAQAFPSRWRRGHVGRLLANDHPNALLFLSTPHHLPEPTQPLPRKSPAPSPAV